jgi:hypothetical protein
MIREIARALVAANGEHPDTRAVAPMPVEGAKPGELIMTMAEFHLWELNLPAARGIAEALGVMVRAGILLPGPNFDQMLQPSQTSQASRAAGATPQSAAPLVPSSSNSKVRGPRGLRKGGSRSAPPPA